MSNQKKIFYIIGHNPNSVMEAEEYLRYGANAIEPDIVYDQQQFFVSHDHYRSYEEIPTLEIYLKGIKELLTEHNFNLSLIVFDMKDANFDINHFLSIVKSCLSDKIFNGVAILVTHPDNINFLNNYDRAYDDVGVGCDESDLKPSQVEKSFREAGQKNYCYADGIHTVAIKPGVLSHIQQAKVCQTLHEPNSFKLIYTWVLHKESSMRKYLNNYIDGIMVDSSNVKDLKRILSSSPYTEVYKLARKGYNPYTSPPVPKYNLTIKTKDKDLAGTDAHILFTLKNATGLSFQSLPFDGNIKGALEQGGTTYATIEGKDLGEISSLTIEAIDADITSGWLPESIIVESSLLKKKLTFIFNSDDSPDEWLTLRGGPIMKLPE